MNVVAPLLLACGADVKAVNANGDTCCSLAAGCGNSPKCLEQLIKFGVDVDVR